MSRDLPPFGDRRQDATYRPRPGAYALLLDDERRLAVVKAPRGGFLPGGGRESGETPEETLLREVGEECGLEVEVLSELGRAREYVHAEGEGCFLLEASFHACRRVGARADLVREPDHELRWLPVPQAVQALRPRSHAWAAARYAPLLARPARLVSPADLVVRDLAPDDVAPCEAVLRALPEWFGIEASLVAYVDSLARLPGHVATLGEDVLGFAAIARPSPRSAELHVIAVRPEHHGRGVGRALLERIEAGLRADGVELLSVKTLGPSHPDPCYARTRRAYERLGFVPLDESEKEWGPEYPCLRLVKPLRGSSGDGTR